jgi:3-phenylpropionate/trans-cinnamate dioxygenase ferredoxin subunit
MTNLVAICKASDLHPGEKVAVEVSNQSILLVNCNGEFCAVSNLCTHDHVELVNGFLMDEEIVCPAHLSRFKLRTGEVSNPPTTIPLKTYKTVLESNEVFVEL